MGQHCTEGTCKQLDYLPMKCDACSQLFCKDHLQYDDHSCSSKYKKNIQVPVCPLCNNPVPVARGTLPDIAVSAHIEADCQTSSKHKVFTNRCNKTKCKKKELVPVICNSCKLNFCLTHRHPADHDCSKIKSGIDNSRKAAAEAAASRMTSSSGQSKISNFFSGPFKTGNTGGGREISPTAAAAPNRQSGRGSTPGRPLMAATSRPGANLQAGMSEDEALAAALAASMDTGLGSSGGQNTGSQEEEDRLLAQALQESEELARRTAQTTGGGQQSDKSCSMQ